MIRSFFLPLIPVSIAVTVGLLLSASNARAEFYKYKDASGTLVITNKFEDVPLKYRKSVKVVWDEELVAKDPFAKRMAAAEARREEQQRQQAPPQEKQGGAGKLRSTDGKTLVITLDEETGQLIRTME